MTPVLRIAIIWQQTFPCLRISNGNRIAASLCMQQADSQTDKQMQVNA